MAVWALMFIVGVVFMAVGLVEQRVDFERLLNGFIVFVVAMVVVGVGVLVMVGFCG